MTATLYTECVVCKKTLGADSRDQGLMFCHNHMKCSVCGEILSAPHAQWCFKKYIEENEEKEISKINFNLIEITHPRCATLKISASMVSVNQTYLDYLNLVRLMVEPNMELDLLGNEKDAEMKSAKFISNMNYETQQTCLARLQACVAQVSITLKLNPTKKKEELNEREKIKQVRARAESLTSSRPVSKSPEDSEEVQLGVFMELHGLTERKIAMEYMQRRNREVAKLVKTGKFSEADALNMIDGMMLKGGFYKK